MLKENLTHIEVTVDEPRIVSEVHTLGELDSNIVDGLDVAAGHIDSQVKVQTLDILEDVAAIVRFHHWKVAAAYFLPETVESCDDICMCLQVDPLSDVLIVGDLANDKLLSEVLMVNNVRGIADDVLDLLQKKVMTRPK